MTPAFKPLLAASPWKVKDNLSADQKLAILRKLYFPVGATPKFDGIRLTTADDVPDPGLQSVAVCRSLKKLPNYYTYRKVSELPPGFDGEALTYPQPDLFGIPGKITLETRPKRFNDIQSDLMTEVGNPLFRFMVFDNFSMDNRMECYEDRVKRLSTLELPDWCILVLPKWCLDAEELFEYNEECLAMGYEGICFRLPSSPAWKISSKDGRSSMREQWLVKMKFFERGEAVILWAYHLMGNNNPVTYNEKGLAERSSHQSGLQCKNMLGGFKVRDLETGVEFNVGGGFDQQQRIDYWNDRANMPGKVLCYMHQPHGAKDAPRIGTFVGFRSRIDMS
jgi:DNA ligase-1